ncbi:MAG: ABC transporter ATP-binding protein [Rhodanobacteraceae bacterium]|nr:ABC transporter ATP-binding protein [Rhodanobacteraceae bacterium]
MIAVAQEVADIPQAASFGGIPGYFRTFREFIGVRVYLVFALQVVEALLEGVGILMLLPLLQSLDAEGAASGRFATWVTGFLGTLGVSGPVAVLALIAGVFVVKGAVAFAAGGYGGYLRADLQRNLQGRLYDAYSKMSYSYYSARDTGYFFNLFSQVFSFIGAFQSFSSMMVGAIKASVYLGMAILVAWRFGVAAIVVGLGLVLLFRRLNLQVRSLSRESAEQMGALSGAFVQSIQAFKYLAATGTAEPLRRVAMGNVERAGELSARLNLVMAFAGAAREPIAMLVIISIVMIQLAVFQQPLAPIMVSILLFYRGVNAVLGLQNSWQNVLAQIGSVEVVRDEFARLERESVPDGGKQIGALSDSIEFRDVSFSYDARVGDVLSQVSFVIPARTTVALVGASGAGKSTIIDLLTLLLAPRTGELLIDGVSAGSIDRASWRRQIGYVLQEAVIFDDSFANNICLWSGDPKTDPELMQRVRRAAQSAHLLEFIESLPDGFNSLVGDRGIRLSGGQRQRLFIARELFKEPRLLILDEATSSLDSEAERVIQQSIDELRGRMTVVIIAHRLATVRSADTVFVFDKGRLVEQGDYAALRDRADSRFSAMVAAQTL